MQKNSSFNLQSLLLLFLIPAVLKMPNIYETIDVIAIGSIVACFLFTTSRVQQAIVLFKECLVILNNKSVDKKNAIIKLFDEKIHLLIIKAYSRIKDYQSAIKYAKELLDIHRECGETAKECELLCTLATLHKDQCKFVEAKETLEKAIELSKKIGNRKTEAESYGALGIVYKIQSEYGKAKEYFQKALTITREIGDKEGEARDYGNLGTVFRSLGEYVKAKEYHEKALMISKQIGDKIGMAAAWGNLGNVLECLSEYVKAKEYLEKALAIAEEMGDRVVQAANYRRLGTVFTSLGEFVKAKENHEKALVIAKEIGDKYLEGTCYGGLGVACQSVGEYKKAFEHHKRALAISREIGHREGEASSYGNLGAISQSLYEYNEAKEYHERALVIRTEIGDREGEAADYGNLGNVFHFLGQYAKANECYEKGLIIRREIGDRRGEAQSYEQQGTVFSSLGQFTKAKEYYVKGLTIAKEIGDRGGEATSCRHIGAVFHSVGENIKAKEYYHKALEITKQIGDRRGEALSYDGLGTVSVSLCEYRKAKEYHERQLTITKEISDQRGEASCYGKLGTVHQSLGEIARAKEYCEKSLMMNKQLGVRELEAVEYLHLAAVFFNVGEYTKAIEFQKKALEIVEEIGYRQGEAEANDSLGASFFYLGKYEEAKTYFEKALDISQEIGDRQGEANVRGNLGTFYRSMGKYTKAKEYQEKAISIMKEIDDRKGQALAYGNLGTVLKYKGEFTHAEECFKKSVLLCEEIGDHGFTQIPVLTKLALGKISKGEIQEAYSYFFQSIQKSEKLRGQLGDHDQFKISLSDKFDFPYWTLSNTLCSQGYHSDALYVSELGRARALEDLLATQYSVESQISANPQSWVGIEKIMKEESNCNCTCLYIAYVAQSVFLWVINTSGIIQFRQTRVKENIDFSGRTSLNFNDFFAEDFRAFPISPKKHCEDRSLTEMPTTPECCQENSVTDFQDDVEHTKKQKEQKNLSLYYKMIISPVAELLKEKEIIIVPERSLYKVPFPALRDENGNYLSDTFRIRIVPSLTTLKLIQNSPADHHSETDALIFGDPDVGRVRYKGKKQDLSRLPCAGKEAAMVGRLLGVEPLLGEQATKEAVLEKLNEVSLIHFAAHGDSDTGEIALAPKRPLTKKIPQEGDYLLKMSDISKVKLRAKLVVLSCCHSGRGQIKAEGVVGIARAFLGSGARSVLVALWALEDSATEQFMSRFYEHLVRGESASESLHEAMKWMRGNGYSDVNQWAPFMLIGDDVTLNFGK